MIITRRIRSLNPYLPLLADVETVVCGITDVNAHQDTLQSIGFSTDLPDGEAILPSASFGAACARNAEGWIEKHRNQPMETYYTPIIWRWREWRGRYDYEDREEMRYRPGQRYPRTEHPPLGMELTIRLKTDGSKIAALDFIPVADENHPRILTSVQMLVEIFGECHLLTEELDSIIRGEVRRLNWRVLPPGRRPWEDLRAEVRPLIRNHGQGTQDVIENRLETINHFQPEFVAIGEHGFSGYLIFGFPNKNLFLLESIFFGNATYVLGEDWERLSQLTKAEILSADLHEGRIIHKEGWHAEINRALS